METIMAAKLAADALIEKGVDVIFTLSGGHITPIYQFLEGTDVQLLDTRHEQSAVFMAEAYGRLTRKPGIAIVTAGPGFTNALTGLANARQANSPLVLISGCVGVRCNEKLDLQDMYQAPIAEPMVKKALVCHRPERVPEFIDMAYRIAGTGRPGPVYLELPVDVLNEKVDAARVKRTHTILDSHPVDIEAAGKILDMISQAEKPIIIAGNGTWYSDASDELLKFVEGTGVPVMNSGMGRGTVSDLHPLCFESGVGTRPGASLLAQADSDLVILLGTRLSLFYMFGDMVSPNAKLIQVDIEGEEIGRNHSVDLGVTGEIKGLLAEMNRQIAEKNLTETLKGRYDVWIETLKATDMMSKSAFEPQWSSDEAPIHALRLAREVNEFMDRDDDTVVADGGDTQIWMGMTRTARTPGHYLDSGLYGCLGVGLPFANAAQYLNPGKRVLLIIGDGAVGFNFMEFETALRKKLPIVVVVANDLGWGMIRHSQELRMGHSIPDGTFIGEVPYHKMLEALGGVGMYVTKPEDIRPALEEAFASGKPALINVMTDPTTVSPGSIALANIGAYK